MSKKIIVTGGAGFIGSAVIRYIIKNTNDTVINLDKLTYAGNLQNLKDVSKSDRYYFHQMDICSEKIAIIFNECRPDIIMHLAAESHVDRSITEPDSFIKTNILGTYNLLKISREYAKNNPDFRFHHISTDEVYGDLGATDDLFHEETSYKPSSPYSASKASSDHLVRAWGRTYNLNTVVTNCSNNYGPYHFPEKLIPHIILNALSHKKLPVYGDGSQIRDWLYVEDHARALYEVATKGRSGETYNIGGHNEVKNIDVVKSICKILDELVPWESKYETLISFVTDRPGHDTRYAIDASKIKNELGWVPHFTFETGLRATVKWYLENKEWYENILNGSYKLERLGEGL